MKENLSIELRNTGSFVAYEEVFALAQRSLIHLDALNSGSGAGNDFLGWLSLPDEIVRQHDKIEKAAKHLRNISDMKTIFRIFSKHLKTETIRS